MDYSAMKKKLGLIFLLGVIVPFFSLITVNVKATDTGYALKPHYGSSQVEQNGQIDLFGVPGQNIQAGVDIANTTNSDLKYKAEFYTAGTSDGGAYEFDNKVKKDSSRKINLKNYVKPLRQIVLVKANSVQTVNFNIIIPSKKFTGYLMGGIAVSPYKQKAQTSLTGKGTLIKNKYSQGIPVKIRQDRNNKKDPKFRIRHIVPTANPTLKSRGVKANVQNYVDGYIGNLNVDALVTRRPNDHKFKVKTTGTAQSVAPNSNYNFTIDWGKEPLQAGNYHLRMKYTTTDKTKSWVINKDFSISNADAAKYNKLSGIKPNYMWLWILIAILALILVLGLGIYFGRRNQQKNQPPMNNQY